MVIHETGWHPKRAKSRVSRFEGVAPHFRAWTFRKFCGAGVAPLRAMRKLLTGAVRPLQAFGKRCTGVAPLFRAVAASVLGTGLWQPALLQLAHVVELLQIAHVVELCKGRRQRAMVAPTPTDKVWWDTRFTGNVEWFTTAMAVVITVT